MRLINTTSIPADTIREVIRFVRPPGISGFDVRVSNCGSPGVVAGTAYTKGCCYHGRWCPLVVCRVARIGWPSSPVSLRRAGYLECPAFADRIEGLVYIMAHELRHLWQARGIRRGRAKGSRGLGFSERDADTYAIEMLEAWRRADAES